VRAAKPRARGMPMYRDLTDNTMLCTKHWTKVVQCTRNLSREVTTDNRTFEQRHRSAVSSAADFDSHDQIETFPLAVL